MTMQTGNTLESHAKRHAPLPGEAVADIIMQLGDALQSAHSASRVHGDLKADNVTYDPESGAVELLDFGSAAVTDTTSNQHLTRGGFIVGTLLYTAPETLSGELITPAADQYSLATIAYLLLTGSLPYSAKTPREMFTQLSSQAPIPLNRARPGLQFEPQVEAVIMRGIAKQRGDRYPSVLTFATELRTALLGGRSA